MKIIHKCPLCKSGNQKEFIRSRRFKTTYVYNSCKNCKCVYLANRPEKEFMDEYYGKTYNYEGFNINRSSLGKYYKEELKIIKKYKGKGKILEIGCASGGFIEAALNHGYDAYGVERSQKVINFAPDFIQERIYCTDNFEEAEGTFDIFYLSHVLEHLEDPQKIFNKIKKIANKRAIVIVKVPNIDSLMARLMKRRWGWLAPPEHFYHFNYHSLKYLTEKNGWEIVYYITRKGDLYYLKFLLLMPFIFLPLPENIKSVIWGITDRKIKISPKVLSLFHSLASPITNRLHRKGLGEEIFLIAKIK